MRSLWLDEAMLATSVMDLPLSRLMPPHMFKVAPFGFVAAEKLVIGVLGTGELAFRLIPLLAGLGSLALFYAASRVLLEEREQLLALAIVALSPPLVFFSSEAKPYSSDVFVLLAITTVALSYLNAPSGRMLLGLGVLGAVAVWVSYPAVFVLAAAGPLVLWSQWSGRRPLRPVVVVGVMWLASFFACYQITIRGFAAREALQRYWTTAFAPFPPLSWSDVAWYGQHLLAPFHHPVGFPKLLVGLAAPLFIVGVVRLWRRRRVATLLLFVPLGATIVASMGRLYPLEGRLVLFWAPALALGVSAGAGTLAIDGRRRWATLVVAVLLLFSPAMTGLSLLQGRTIQVEPAEETRPLVNELRRRVRARDAVYVYYGARSAVRYYARRMGWTHPLHYAVSHRGDPEGYLQDVDAFRGARLWVVFSHVHRGPGGDERRLILDHLRRQTEPVERILKPGASAYCFDLR